MNYHGESNVLLIRSLLEQHPAARGGGKAVVFQGRGSGDGENARLPGRQAECALLDQLVAAVRTGESRVLVVHGDPGIGKSALVGETTRAGAARGMLVLGTSGAQSEADRKSVV